MITVLGYKVSLRDGDQVLDCNDGCTTLCRCLMLLNHTLKRSLASLVAHWLRIHLPRQGPQFRSHALEHSQRENRPCSGHRESNSGRQRNG